MEWATFGPFLAKCRQTFLREMQCCRHALILGDGDGRFTAQLLRVNPEIRIDAIDASPAMLLALMQRAGGDSQRLRTRCLDARDWQPSSAKYDLIVTHFFLDCLTTDEVLALANRVRSASAPGAIWGISEFAIPRNLFGRLVAAPVVRALYCAFGLLTGLKIRRLPDYAFALESTGFVPVSRHSWLSGLLSSQLWVSH
jgi:hypothetical protein